MDPSSSEELINAVLDREADANSQAVLTHHMANDSSAQVLSDQLRRQDEQLRRAFATRRIKAADIALRVEQTLQNLPRIQSDVPMFRRPWLAALLGLAAGFLLAAMLFRPWQKAERPTDDSRTAQTVGTVEPTGAARAIPQPAIVEIAMARLTLATGPVEIRPRGELQLFNCPVRGAIAGGMEVCTGEQVSCELSTPDGSAIRMNSDTTLRFDQPRAIAIQRGQLWSSVARSSSPMSIEAVDAIVQTEEAVLDFSCNGQQSRLRVLRGTARVTGKAGPKTVQAGHEITMQNGTLTGEKSTDDSVLSTSWMNNVLRLKAPDDTELQDRIQQLLASIGSSKLANLYEDEIRSLGEGSVPPMIFFLRRTPADAQRNKRIEAARILADLAATQSISDLITLLDDGDGLVRFHVARALQRLTDNTFDCSPTQWRDGTADERAHARQAWQQWWTENKARYGGLSNAPQSQT